MVHYIHIHECILSYFKIYVYQTIFFCQCYRFICQFSFFLANVTSKTLSHSLSSIFSQVDIIKVSVVLSTISQYSSTFHSLFNKEKTSAETKTKLDVISSIWDDSHILRLDEKNWQCLWCNTSFQGINSTKDLDQVLGKKGMHIKRCYVPKEKSHITRYQEIQHFKQAWKVLLL